MSDAPLLKNRDFRLLLIGQTTSQLGAQVSGVAIPLLAVLTLDASPIELGLVTASSTLAFALIGLPAGAWLDRWRKLPVLVASDLIRALLLVTIPLAALFGVLTIIQLVIVALLTGFARVFFDVGYQSYLPSVMGKERILAGNSFMEAIRASGQVVGPGLGGGLVALVGGASVVLLQSVTFVVSAVCLIGIRTREAPVPAHPDRPRLWTQIVEGLAFVARNRILRATALASAAGNFSFAISSAVTFIFLSRTLDLSPLAIGLIVAAGSVSAIVGAAFTPVLSRRVGSVRVIWLALVATGPLAVLTPLAQPGWSALLVVVAMAAGELGQIVYAVTNVSLRQRLCPDDMLSRVNATMRVLIMGLFPLGALVGGMLGELIGLRGTLWVAGGLILLSPIPLIRTFGNTRDIESLAAWRTQP
ncbi:MFS transporter [Mycetocola zhadangensis]|uniref:MFS transporter n=1 Tax=Mycetocola zhadangensis TaxID=1164595 RepID=A0A3L7J0J4_9MICO|nr:MFS transporter [Mycetocola zhadangensis]RLQ83947.1 MFS transporter [Mycetocola zhadangensis]GGE97493.1 MFS transporter [Mycetocola zhadangensis]